MILWNELKIGDRIKLDLRKDVVARNYNWPEDAWGTIESFNEQEQYFQLKHGGSWNSKSFRN